MRWGPLLLCGWPGLARLWFRGQWSSLWIAIAFSILLNLALVSSFLWPWSLGETFPLIAWPLIFLVWIASTTATYRNLPALMTVPGHSQTSIDTSDALFIQAQREYLMGHWTEVESLITRCLDKSARARSLRSPRHLESARSKQMIVSVPSFFTKDYQ